MANSDNIRTVTFILETNAKVAGFASVSKEMDKMHKNLLGIANEMDKLDRAGKKDTDRYRELNAEFQKASGNLKELVRQQGAYLDGLKLEEYSLNQLKVIRKQLLQQVSYAQADTREFRKAATQLKAVNEQMTRIKTLAGEAGSMFGGMGKFASGITKLFAAFGLGIGVLSAVGNKLREVWQTIKDVSESYSDIRKVTNLNIPETTRLTGRLAAMDTRTSIPERMQLAVVGGRMGIDGVSQLADFARASDKIVVSLGDTLTGSADEIISKLAKIVNAFDVTGKEGISFSEAMERIGSSLNQVAAEGVASEEWQVDFLVRAGAISRVLKITAQDMLGYGVALEEAGNTVEVSGTAMSQFLGVIAQNAGDFANKAQMPVEKFIHLLETDANQAILAVLRGIKDGATSNTELIRTFSELGIDGERATKVILSLANNLDKVTEKQALANDEFDKNTALLREYEKRQVSISGAMERLGNNIQEWFVNSGLEGWLKSIFNAMADITATNPSEELEKERIQLALTEAKLRDTNIAWEDKLDMVKELQNDYPGLFQNIETEADLYATLAGNMERANGALHQKIMMQKNEEEMSKYVKIQLDAEANIDKHLTDVQTLADEIKNKLPRHLRETLPKLEGISSFDVENYANLLKAKYNEYLNVKPDMAAFARQMKDPLNFENIAKIVGNRLASGQTGFTLDSKGYGSKFSQLDALSNAIFHQEQLIKGAEGKINDITKEQVLRQKIKDNTLNPDGKKKETELTRQDYLETMRSVGTGGTSYRKYNPTTERFESGEVISEDRLKEFKDVLALQEKIIDKTAKAGHPISATGLQNAFIADAEYDKYADFLSVKGAMTGLDKDKDKKAKKAAKEASDRRQKMASVLAKMGKWGTDKQRESDIGRMDDYDAQLAKLSDQLQRGIDDFRAEYISAAGGKLSTEEQATIDNHVKELQNLKGRMLGVFDDTYQQEMLDKMFDLSGTDQQKALRKLDKEYEKYFVYWQGRLKNATTDDDKEYARTQIGILQGAYNRDYADTAEKYKPEDQKRADSKQQQVYNAKLLYDGVVPSTAKETDEARSVNDLMGQLYGDNWQAVYDAHNEFLQSDYDNEVQFLKDKVKAHKDAEKEIADFRRDLATTSADSLARVASASISLEAERNNAAMQHELERYEGNEKKQQEIRKKYARQEAALKARQAVVDYMAGMVALIAKSWGQGGIFGGILAGIQAAAYTATLGFQLEQMQAAADSFAQGKYDTVRSKDGKRYTARIKGNANRTQFVKEPTYFRNQNYLTGEQGPEIIISGDDTNYLRQFQPEVIDAIGRLPGAQGFAKGLYPPDMKRTTGHSGNSGSDRELIATLHKLEKKMETPFMGIIVADEKNMLAVKKSLDNLGRRQRNSQIFNE